MSPLQVAAKFAAHVWYTNNRQGPRSVVQAEARRFARKNWQAFLPIAHEGLGRLLIEVGKHSAKARAKRISKRRLAVAG